MLFRKCAGGVVFNGDQVFLLENDKSEWVLPKGIVRGDSGRRETALSRVLNEAGVSAEILEAVGETTYEFYSVSRRMPVCNQILWYIMKAQGSAYEVNRELGFRDGGYFSMEEALDLITYTQDRSLLRLAYERYRVCLAAQGTRIPDSSDPSGDI